MQDKAYGGWRCLKVYFVQVTIHGKNFATLVDMGATHSFLSKKATSYFGNKKVEFKKELSAFKAINYGMEVVTYVLKNTQVRVGSWFGRLDLRVIEMDDHAMVLRKEFFVAP